MNPHPVRKTLPLIATSEPLPPERIVWDKTPIRLTLPVGRERLVHFPAPVKVGVPAQLEASLRTQSVAGTVYWLAHEAFTAQRIQVREIASGQLYLLDLAAQEGAPATPVVILRPDADDTPDTVTEAGKNAPQPAHPPTLGFVSLTRYAAQQMYAPTRLHQALPGVYRVPLKSAVVPLVRGGQVQALPLITWRGGDFYVTVVRLRNLTTRPLILDPRNLRGTWHAATFQHARLLPAGDEADTTCVYLISARPFADALRGVW